MQASKRCIGFKVESDLCSSIDLFLRGISIISFTTQLLGSSTLCAVALGMNNTAYFYNIGDSGLFLFRFGVSQPTAQRKEWFVHSVSPKQCHAFNFPFQLGKGADSVLTERLCHM